MKSLKNNHTSLYINYRRVKMKKIRIGIDLDHVIRDINRQIVKYYQKDFDESIDMDEVDYKDDVINTVCHFENKKAADLFMYEDYPLEIFGHAGQISRNLSRDLNQWMQDITNQEKYDVEIFFFSMKEYNLTIQSSYFFLSKIGSRVRKVVFPKSYEELKEYGDVYITANTDTAKYLNKNNKKVVFVKMNFNQKGLKYSDITVNDFREFLDFNDKLEKISNILNDKKTCQNKKSEKSLWTSMRCWISSFLPMKKETRT